MQPSDLPIIGRAYPDASMLDGPSSQLGRLGWAFVVVDAESGQVLAAAFGAVPAWIVSMPAAEGWALYMATTVMMTSSVYVSDCLEVVRSIHKGPSWAEAPSRVQARLYGMIMPVFENDVDRAKVTWMPSHLTASTASQRRKLDGSEVTECDLAANRYADALAKRGAGVHRVPAEARARCQEAQAAATWIARAVGFATWAANHRSEAPARDAEPDQGWKRRRQRQPRRRPRPPRHEPRPVALGGHHISRTSDGWRCGLCLSRSSHWCPFASQRCPGAAAARWAERARRLAEAVGHGVGGGTDGVGHTRFISDFTTWCDNCGSYADTFAVGLARVCPGRPTCAGKEQHLRRLRRGRHPVTNVPFRGQPIPEPTATARLAPRRPQPSRAQPWGSATQVSSASSSPLGAARACWSTRTHIAVHRAPRVDPSRAESVQARMRALRERVRARAGPSDDEQDQFGGAVASVVFPLETAGRRVRRRVTGKTPRETSEDRARLGASGASASSSDPPSVADRASATRGLDGSCPSTDSASKRRRLDALGQFAGGYYESEPSSRCEDGPVIAAPKAYQSRAQLIAQLASSGDAGAQPGQV